LHAQIDGMVKEIQMLGYTTKNACRTRMDIIAMIVGLIGGNDDMLPCIKLPLFALGLE